MMTKYKVLILTDHTKHTAVNSLYALTAAMAQHPLVEKLDIVSRKTKANADFFNCEVDSQLWGTSIDQTFSFRTNNHPLEQHVEKLDIDEYDFVWLRMPPPLGLEFLDFLSRVFIDKLIINNPKSIYETGSKAFLMNFQDICPPMKICNTIDDIIAFSGQFPIVLKPFREYGGRGILKVEGDSVFSGNEQMSFDEFNQMFLSSPIEYLGVKYLKNVKKGDKRIVVIDGEIMGASLRLPPEDSWICNVAMGGTSNHSEVSEEEIQIVKTLDPILNSKGILMYGVDTLVADDGRRVLSEINTTSIGGLPQIAKLKKLPLVEKGIDIIIQYVVKQQRENEL